MTSSLEDALNKQRPFLIFLHKYFRRLKKHTDLCLICRPLINGGSSIPGRTSNCPQGLQCPPGHGKDKMVGTATFLQGLFTWVREPDGRWRAEPSFYQKRHSPHCLPFLYSESIVLGDPSITAAQDHITGDTGLHTDRHHQRGRGCKASQNR